MKVKPAKALAEWKKVRKEARFSWPVEPRDFWVSSLYGPRRNPNGRIAFHAGVDMAAQKGTIGPCCWGRGGYRGLLRNRLRQLYYDH